MSHDEWQTPRALIDRLEAEWGRFELDAAATLSNTVCSRYIDSHMNALLSAWSGHLVWCNPPYTQIGPFVERAYHQHVEQKNTVIVLLPAYTDPKYWAEYVMKAHEIRFLKGRLQFLKNGQKKQSARFPSVVVIFKYIAGQHYGRAPQQWVWDWRSS